jgi:hypothetical protein
LVSKAFALANVQYAVSFNAMWDKGTVTAPIPSASVVNRIEMRIYDSSNSQVFNQRITVPNQTGAQERATLTSTFTPAATGLFTVELFMRHSNLAELPFTCYVDDIVFGTAGGTCRARPRLPCLEARRRAAAAPCRPCSTRSVSTRGGSTARGNPAAQAAGACAGCPTRQCCAGFARSLRDPRGAL